MNIHFLLFEAMYFDNVWHRTAVRPNPPTPTQSRLMFANLLGCLILSHALVHSNIGA